jgi:hypothetical protein
MDQVTQMALHYGAETKRLIGVIGAKADPFYVEVFHQLIDATVRAAFRNL